MDPLPREIFFADVATAVGIAGVFVLVMSFVREPARQNFNAVFVGGAGAAYLNGGMGLWEFAFVGVATTVAYLGLRSYRFIGLAWLLHTAWDVVHHLYAEPIIAFQPTSSAGCAITDVLIAIWFFAGAPSVVPRWSGKLPAAEAAQRR